MLFEGLLRNYAIDIVYLLLKLFVNYFLVGYLKTKDYNQALLYGSVAGSATAFHDGLMTIADFNELWQQVGEEYA